jgi:hypothetical protein
MRIFDCQVEFYFPFENDKQKGNRNGTAQKVRTRFISDASKSAFPNKCIYLECRSMRVEIEMRPSNPCLSAQHPSTVYYLNFRRQTSFIRKGPKKSR